MIQRYIKDIGMPEWGVRHTRRPTADNRGWRTPYRAVNGTMIPGFALASPQWNSAATQQHDDGAAVVFEDMDISAFRSALQPGENVLAIHGLNQSTSSSDLLIVPELVAVSTSFDPNQLRFFTSPTPGAPNGDGILGFVGDTSFSVKRGFYDAPFDVEITTDVTGATIQYTTDGSEPSETHGTTYTGPIRVETTTTLRAFAFLEGYLPTDADTQTYIFLDDVLQQPAAVAGYPQPTINTGSNQSVPLDYEMDPAVVNDPAYNTVVRDGLLGIPTISLVAPVDDIFGSSGFMYNGGGAASGPEHEVSLEFIYPDDVDRGFQINAGAKPHSHLYLKRSIRLYFRSDYGDAKLRSDIFSDAPLFGDSATDQFDRLVLRAGGNRNFVNYWNPDDSTYTRDEWARASQLVMADDPAGAAGHGTFVHLYINGLYWGLYNPVERTDHFFQAAYDDTPEATGEQSDYFAVNHGGVISGDASRWNYLKGALKDKDMSVAANYQELQEYLDVEQFADYILLNLCAGTDDWPNNNWYGGYRVGPTPTPMQFFVWDAEDVWDNEGSSGPFDRAGGRGSDGAWITPELRKNNGKTSGPDIAKIFHSLRDSQQFMLLFADRAYQHLFHGGALADANSQARWDALNDYVSDAIVAESARWGDARETLPGETNVIRTRDDTWQPEVDRVRNESMPGNAVKTVQVLRAEGYYPGIDPSTLSQHGGTITAGFQLAISNPNGTGTVYFTTDWYEDYGTSPVDNPFAATYRVIRTRQLAGRCQGLPRGVPPQERAAVPG